jgi:hypothetical protein
MNGGDDHRTRSQEMWREVMQADAPPVSDPYTEMTTDHGCRRRISVAPPADYSGSTRT